MTSAHSIGRWVLSLGAIAYVYGALLGLFALGWEWLFRDGPPRWEWWQYLVAPLAIGLVAMALEGIGTMITRGDDTRHPTWKRAIRMLVVFLFLVAVVLGPALYKIGHS